MYELLFYLEMFIMRNDFLELRAYDLVFVKAINTSIYYRKSSRSYVLKSLFSGFNLNTYLLEELISKAEG